MSTALGLSIYAAVVSSIVAAIQWLSHRADRCELIVSRELSFPTASDSPRGVVIVHNAGKRPTTITEVGFFAEVSRAALDQLTPPGLEGRGANEIVDMALGADTGRVVPPGATERYPVVWSELPDFLHPDLPMRAYARDGRWRLWFDKRSDAFFRQFATLDSTAPWPIPPDKEGSPPVGWERPLRLLPFPFPWPRTVIWQGMRRDPGPR